MASDALSKWLDSQRGVADAAAAIGSGGSVSNKELEAMLTVSNRRSRLLWGPYSKFCTDCCRPDQLQDCQLAGANGSKRRWSHA